MRCPVCNKIIGDITPYHAKLHGFNSTNFCFEFESALKYFVPNPLVGAVWKYSNRARKNWDLMKQ